MKRHEAVSAPDLCAFVQNPRKKAKGFKWLRYECLAAVLFTLLTAPAAFGQVNFTQTVTFGDSLTNNDFLGLYYGNPQDMYGADPMEAVFKKGAKSGNRLMSYAVASTESQYLPAEIGAYMAAMAFGKQKKATLFNIETGGNDILNHINLIKAYPPGKNRSADNVVNAIIRNMQNSINTLKRVHPKAQFVLWTIPDVTLIPREWEANTATEIANIRAHLNRANQAITQMGNPSTFVVLDLYTLIQSFISDPPVIFGQELLVPPIHSEYDSIFADEIHPTAVSNALIANTIIAQMNKKWRTTISSYTEDQLAKLAHIQY